VTLGNKPDRRESANEPDPHEPEIPEEDVERSRRGGQPRDDEPWIPEGRVESSVKEELPPMWDQLSRSRRRKPRKRT